MECPSVNGFCKKILKTVCQKSFTDAFHGVGCQGNDHRQSAVFATFTADVLYGFYAIHTRHHMIHENNVKQGSVDKLYGFHAALGFGDLQVISL